MSGKSRIDPVALRDLHNQSVHPSEAAKVLNCTPDAVISQWHNMGLAWERKSVDLRKSLTPEQEASVIARYRAGEGATRVGRAFGVDKATVYNILRRSGVGTRSVASRRKPNKYVGKTMRLSDRDLEIKKRFLAGERCPDIALAVDVTECAVRYSLKKQQAMVADDKVLRVVLPPNPRNKGLGKGNREFPLNANLRHDAFDSFNEHSLYWLGFLLADGNVYTGAAYGQPKITIQLQRGDRPHLEKFKAWMDTNTSIVDGQHFSFGKMHEHSALSFHSTSVARALRELGVVNHKEGRFVSPAVANSKDFWRGLVDGDGSIYSPAEGVAYLSGQPPIIDAWTTFCESVCGHGCIRREDRDTVSIGSLRFRAEGKTLLPLLYKNASIFLDRKMAEAKAWW